MESYYLSKAVFKILKAVHRKDAQSGLTRRFPNIFFNPHMDQKEYFLFKELCKNNQVFIEYGSGGSTIYLLKTNKIVFSVESNPAFYDYMQSMKFVRSAMGKNLHYRFVDIGPTNQWGKPLSDDHSEHWPAYYEQVWEEIDPFIHKVDVVFIDGRFRVCCCLYSILKALEYNWKNIVFVMHDFWRREKYHVVLDYLKEIQSTDNLASFRMKDHINVRELKERLEKYAFVTA